MPKVQLGQEDMEDALRIYNAIVRCLENLPNDLMENEKFGLMMVNVMLNIICTVAISAGTDKQEIMRGLEQVYDSKRAGKPGVLN